MEKLKATPYSYCEKILREDQREDSTTSNSYQAFEIVNVSSNIEYFERHFASWIDAVTSNLRM